MQLLIGADPEVFLKTKNQPSEYYSGYNVIPGTKAIPYPVEKGAIQVDGMALEFNITPVQTEDDFVINISTVMDILKSMIPKEFEIEISPIANFSKEHMDMQPEEATRLGCDPDFNAYSMSFNPPPTPHPTMRTAAGHIHLGWTENCNPADPGHIYACSILAKQLDFYLGLIGTIYDPDIKRKEMYGKAGAFRPKSYGIEYRVLSNFWLNTEKLMRLIFNNAVQGFNELAIKGNNLSKRNSVRDIINTNDSNEAKKYCEHLKIKWII